MPSAIDELQAVRRTPRIVEIAAKNWSSIFLLILLVVFSFTGKGFFGLANLQTIVHLSTVLLLLAVAETFVIISGGIDLSVGMVMGFTAILSATLFGKGPT